MDSLTKIKQPVSRELERFRLLFDSSLDTSSQLLEEVVCHIRQRDGKMMRPTLVLLMAKLCGGITDSTLYGAVALELLHTASLVHDDVVDESDLRRGQLSVNASYNNKIAVLVGDYILATCLVQAGKTKNRKIINTISSLGQQLSEGELLQLSSTTDTVFSEENYFNVIRKKTAALFSACSLVGVLSVTEDRGMRDLARQIGENVGISFQIKDDIFDYYSAEEEVGKPTGNDMLEGKLTLPAIYAVNNSSEEWVKDLAIRVRSNKATAEEIAMLIEYSKQNGGIQYALEKMEEYHSKGVGMLNSLPDSDAKASLLVYADYAISRNK